MTDIVVRYFHFIAIFVMFAMLNIQHIILKGEVEPGWFKKAAAFDVVYGICALIALAAGIALWVWVGKPAGFYSANWVFHLKIMLFVVVGILSFMPTRFLLKNKANTVATTIPKSITMLIRVQLLLLCIIPFLAVTMANGIGYTK